MKNNKPRSSLPKNILTCDWEIHKFLEALNKRSIEYTIGIDGVTEDCKVSFNIRHRRKDKELIKALLKALFGTVKQ